MKRTHMLASREIADDVIGLILWKYQEGISESDIRAFRKGKKTEDVLWLLLKTHMLEKDDGKYIPTALMKVYFHWKFYSENETNCRRILLSALKDSDTHFRDVILDLEKEVKLNKMQLIDRYDLNPPVYQNIVTWLRTALAIATVTSDDFGEQTIRLTDEGRSLLGEDRFSASEFWGVVKEGYVNLTSKRRSEYVEIEKLAEYVCKRLNKDKRSFNDMFYGPIRPEFRLDLSTAPGFEGFKYVRIWTESSIVKM